MLRWRWALESLERLAQQQIITHQLSAALMAASQAHQPSPFWPAGLPPHVLHRWVQQRRGRPVPLSMPQKGVCASASCGTPASTRPHRAAQQPHLMSCCAGTLLCCLCCSSLLLAPRARPDSESCLVGNACMLLRYAPGGLLGLCPAASACCGMSITADTGQYSCDTLAAQGMGS